MANVKFIINYPYFQQAKSINIKKLSQFFYRFFPSQVRSIIVLYIRLPNIAGFSLYNLNKNKTKVDSLRAILDKRAKLVLRLNLLLKHILAEKVLYHVQFLQFNFNMYVQ